MMRTQGHKQGRAEAGAVRLLRGGPGAGKTGFLVRRAREALAGGLSPARVLVVAPDAAAAELIRERLAEAAQAAPPCAMPQVLTGEQLARMILNESETIPPEGFLGPLAERLLVGRALRDTGTGARHFRAEELRHSGHFRDQVADFIAELKRLKLSPERFREEIVPGLRQPEALHDLAEAYARYQELVQARRVYDLRGLLWLALAALERGGAAGEWAGRYELIVADDLQDATALELELLARLAGPGTELVGVWEPAQSLYRFRGAVADPAALWRELLPGREVEEGLLPLGEGALPQAVAARAEQFGRWCERESAPVGRAETQGEVRWGLYRSLQAELAAVAEEILRLLNGGEMLPEEMAVITRRGEEARIAGEYLALRGIPVGGEAGAPELWQARRLLGDLTQALQARLHAAGHAVARLAAQEAGSRALVRLADLTAEAEERLALPGLLKQGRDLLREGLPEGFPALRWLREQVAEAGGQPARALRRLATSLLRKMAPERGQAWAGPVAALLGQLEETEEWLKRLTGTGLSPAEVGTVLAEAHLRPAFRRPAVAILTAHESRGQRFRQVFVVGLQEEIFPAPGRVSRLLEAETGRQLRERVRRAPGLPAGVVPFAGLGEAAAEALEEEERLFFTCLTRSGERLWLSGHLEAGGGPVMPSPFLGAVLPEDFLLPEGAAAAEFQCVFAGLAPEGEPARSGHEGCPVRPCAWGQPEEVERPERAEARPLPHSETPVLGEVAKQLVLYPSHLESYLRCPRQYYLGSLLRVADEEESDPAAHGSAVHDFLRKLNLLQPEQRTPEAARELLEAVLGRWAERFSSPLAAAMYAGVARAALEAYLGSESAQARVLLAERQAPFEVAGETGQAHRFDGRIDVVVEEGDGAAVVDFKSGSVDSARNLKASIPRSDGEARFEGRRQVQLPMYALAWEAHAGAVPCRSMCLQRFAPEDCRRVCVRLEEEDDEGVLSRVELEAFRGLLARWAEEIKTAREFGGVAPPEGCNPFGGRCPFAGVCDEAELA